MSEEQSAQQQTQQTEQPAQQQTQQTAQQVQQQQTPQEIQQMAQAAGFSPADFQNVQTVDQARQEIARRVNAQLSATPQQFAQQQPMSPPVEQYQPLPPQVPGTPQGFYPNQYPQWQYAGRPQYQGQSGPQIDYESLGIEKDSPAAKLIEAQQHQFGSLTQQVQQQFQQYQQQFQEQQRSARVQNLRSEADQVVAGFDSPIYGPQFGQKTYAQQVATERLFAVADDIGRAQQSATGHHEPLSVRLHKARYHDESIYGVQPQAPAGSQPQQQMLTAQGHQKTAGGQWNPSRFADTGFQPNIDTPDKPMKMTDRWSENPESLAAIAQS